MKQIKDSQLSHFCEQFHIILHSGISSIDGLSILSEDAGSDRNKELFSSMQKDMEESGSLAHAMESAGVFPASMTAYVRVGEETGCLDEVMQNLAVHYQNESEISSQIRTAVTYPLLMLAMMGAVIVILLVKVLPVFQQVFRQMGMEMNSLSRNLLGAGDVMSRYSAVFLAIVILIAAAAVFLIYHPKGRQAASRIVSRIPYVRRIPKARDYARLTQGIALGLRSGLSPDRSMELSEALISQPEMKEHVKKAVELQLDGSSFSDSLVDSGLFQGLDARLISIGFQTGSGDEVMANLSEQYQIRAMDEVSGAISVLEPSIIILLSVLVGLVLLAVMMPLLGVFTEMIG